MSAYCCHRFKLTTQATLLQSALCNRFAALFYTITFLRCNPKAALCQSAGSGLLSADGFAIRSINTKMDFPE